MAVRCCCAFPITKLRRPSTVSATTIRSPGSDSRNMKCGPGPRRLAPRNSTACKRNCRHRPPLRRERTPPYARPRLYIAAGGSLCSSPLSLSQAASSSPTTFGVHPLFDCLPPSSPPPALSCFAAALLRLPLHLQSCVCFLWERFTCRSPTERRSRLLIL